MFRSPKSTNPCIHDLRLMVPGWYVVRVMQEWTSSAWRPCCRPARDRRKTQPMLSESKLIAASCSPPPPPARPPARPPTRHPAWSRRLACHLGFDPVPPSKGRNRHLFSAGPSGNRTCKRCFFQEVPHLHGIKTDILVSVSYSQFRQQCQCCRLPCMTATLMMQRPLITLGQQTSGVSRAINYIPQACEKDLKGEADAGWLAGRRPSGQQVQAMVQAHGQTQRLGMPSRARLRRLRGMRSFRACWTALLQPLAPSWAPWSWSSRSSSLILGQASQVHNAPCIFASVTLFTKVCPDTCCIISA